MFPASDGARLATIMPNAALHVFARTGHMVHEERAEAAEAIIEFLDRTEG